MRTAFLILLAGLAANGQTKSSAFIESPATNLPAYPIGPKDLLNISVYGAPELSKTVRVGQKGEISLPMLKAPMKVLGLMPSEVEALIAERLEKEEILVGPVVTATIAEYSSRPITVAGAVKTPLTFQAIGEVRLLEAISKAGGLTPEAGSEVLVSRSDGEKPETLRILVKDLLSGADASTNPVLTGGEEIRIPESGRVFVVGNVKKPGAYALRDSGSVGVLQVLALAEGLAPYSSKKAYILRPTDSGARKEIEIPLSEILRRKRTDVEVLAGDIVYVPDSKTGKLGIVALERILLFGSTAGATALIYAR